VAVCRAGSPFGDELPERQAFDEIHREEVLAIGVGPLV
jgi:hypothetical protein